MPTQFICQQCNTIFTVTPGSKGIYCSKNCYSIAISKIYKDRAMAKKYILIQEYNLCPNKCTQCLQSLEYDSRKNKFCSRSCATTFNNTGRTHSDETKEKIKLAALTNPTWFCSKPITK
jgi:ferredoxin